MSSKVPGSRRRQGGRQVEAEKRINKALQTAATELDLSRLRLTSLPESLGGLTQLEYLDVSYNGLTSLPEWLGGLSQLRSLDVLDNRLTSLPESLGGLVQMFVLDVSDNGLTSLPEWLGGLSQLRFLGASSIRLASMPEWLGGLSQLQSLYVSNNGLTSLPEWLGGLTQLRILDVSGNGLTSLPEWLGGLTQLRILDVSGNGLTSLPESLGGLSQLQTFDVSRNELASLPEWLGGLTQLRTLNVSHTELTSLPEWLKDLTGLEELFLHANYNLGIPVEILGPLSYEVTLENKKAANPSDIINYYFQAQIAQLPINEAKLILVGFGGVGKTSLVNRLVHDRFDSQEGRTDGIAITDWPMQAGNDEVRLHLWDFGGQEIMHATHQFFLTQRSLYLLVLSGREGREDADADYWLSLIASFAPDSPVIIVLNKTREHPFALNRGLLQQKFSNIREIIATDCADRTGLDVLDAAIRRETDLLPHLRDPFPRAWFQIKDRLSGMTDNFLTFDRYRTICREHGEEDGATQDRLANILHHLGIALNYRDDPRLNDRHVLNPRWVTEGVYALLTHPTLAECEGVLRLDHLAAILDRATYPPECHAFLVELMRKFELCFRFPEDQDRYLVPELLSKEQPAEADAFPPEGCLNFEYHYPTQVPEGLLPRFIVRSYVLSEGQPRWRTGAVLALERNRALVAGDPVGRRVRVAIDGPVEARRRLLAVIRADFDRIHANYTFKPEEMIPVPDHPEVLVPYRELLTLESKGHATYPKVAGDDVLMLDVRRLLDGVDLERTRPMTAKRGARQIGAFVSYSHKDERYRAELDTHLKLLQRQGLLDLWSDRRIAAGSEWKGQIDDNLERADLILLLVSADFVASDYCFDVELGRALERHEAGEARVIPIIVRDVDWHAAPFAKLQALPKEGGALAASPGGKPGRDKAWTYVANQIGTTLKELGTTRPR